MNPDNSTGSEISPQPTTDQAIGQQPIYNLPLSSTKKRPIKIYILVLVLIAIILALVTYLVLSKTEKSTESTQSDSSLNSQQNKLGGSLTIVEGLVQTSFDSKTWTDAIGGEDISESQFVRTRDNSRAVILLDDGSTVRLDDLTQIEVSTSSAEAINVTLSSGQVYTRVSEKAGRVFSVITPNDTFEALGTAYRTQVGGDKGDSVEVFQSEVKVKSKDSKVEEGNKYNTLDNQKVSLDLSALESDDFIAWNKTKDLENEEYKSKLGVLEPKPVETEAEENKPTESPKPAPAPKPAAGSISLSGSSKENGLYFEWSVKNTTAKDGFKLVRSTSNNNPVYKTHTAVYIGKESSNYLLDLRDGKSYYYRICAFRAESGTCDSYSNSIRLTSPNNPPETIQPGAISLNISGRNISWSHAGTAPHGFKVVMSSSSAPTYPANSIQYVSAGTSQSELPGKEAGTYYVRVCKYTNDANINGGCMDYSNEVVYTVD